MATTEIGQATGLATLLPMLAADRRRLGLGGFYYYTWASTDAVGSSSPFTFSGLQRYDPNTHELVAKPALATFRRRTAPGRCSLEVRGAPALHRPGTWRAGSGRPVDSVQSCGASGYSPSSWRLPLVALPSCAVAAGRAGHSTRVPQGFVGMAADGPLSIPRSTWTSS